MTDATLQVGALRLDMSRIDEAGRQQLREQFDPASFPKKIYLPLWSVDGDMEFVAIHLTSPEMMLRVLGGADMEAES